VDERLRCEFTANGVEPEPEPEPEPVADRGGCVSASDDSDDGDQVRAIQG
jgi:hypothetical protein